MADDGEDQRMTAQLKVLTGLKLPNFDWKANNMRMEFDIFEQTLDFMLMGMEIPKKKWYLYILQQLGREGMEQWNASIKDTVQLDDPSGIIKAFKKATNLRKHTGLTGARTLAAQSKAQARQQLLLQLGLKSWWPSVSGQTERRREDA